jgi:hypothetical protein
MAYTRRLGLHGQGHNRYDTRHDTADQLDPR